MSSSSSEESMEVEQKQQQDIEDSSESEESKEDNPKRLKLADPDDGQSSSTPGPRPPPPGTFYSSLLKDVKQKFDQVQKEMLGCRKEKKERKKKKKKRKKTKDRKRVKLDISRVRNIIRREYRNDEGEGSLVYFQCFIGNCAPDKPEGRFKTEGELLRHFRDKHNIRNQKALEDEADIYFREMAEREKQLEMDQDILHLDLQVSTSPTESEKSESNSRSNDSLERQPDASFTCPISFCENATPPSSFGTEPELICHINIVHGGTEHQSDTETTHYVCSTSFCKNADPSSSFGTKWEYSDHFRICHGEHGTESPRQENPYWHCYCCKWSFSYKDFKNHALKFHNYEDPLICGICKLRFKSTKHLRAHIEATHFVKE